MKRYLVVANLTVLGDDLQRLLLERAERDASSEFHLLMPASLDATEDHALAASENLHWPGEARLVASERVRLKAALDHMAELGLTATGEIVVADPVTAAADVLEASAFDEVIVSTLPARLSRWLRVDVPSRLRRRTSTPVVHVEATVSSPV